MKRSLITIAFLTALALPAQADNSMLYPIIQYGKWGYIDRAGTVVVKPEYDRAYAFSGGLGIVVKDGLYGYVNASGKVVVNPKFIEAYPYSGSYARVMLAGRYGFIDRTGSIVVQPLFTECWDFVSDRARVRYGSFYGFVDPSGKLVVPARYTGADDFSEGFARVNVASFEVCVSNNTYVHDTYAPFTNYLRYVVTNKFVTLVTNVKVFYGTNLYLTLVSNIRVTPVTNKQYSFVSNSNRVYIRTDLVVTFLTNYDRQTVEYPKPGWVTDVTLTRATNLYFEDRTNAEPGVVTNRQITREFVGVFTNESQSNRMCGFVNRGGSLVIPAIYRNARSFHGGLAAVQTYDGYRQLKWGYIDGRGQTVIPPQFDEALDFREGLAPVRSGSRWGYIGTNGAFVIQPAYSYAGNFRGGYARVGTGGSVQNGTYFGGRWTLIDRTGRAAGNTQFQWIDAFSDGLACVRQNDQWGYVNLSGSYKVLPALKEVYPIREGLARVNANGLYGFLNPNGNTAIAPAYDAATDFHGGLALVSLRRVDSYTLGYIDGTGKWIWSSVFNPLSTFLPGENVSVIGPGVDLWKTETMRSASPIRITAVEIGAPLVVLTSPRNSGFLSMHGMVGSWMTVDYLDNKGTLFSGYISRLPVPSKGMDIEDYFDNSIGLIDERQSLPNFSPDSEVDKTYALGITMRKFVQAGKTVKIFRIPSIRFQEVYALMKLCMGFPEAPLAEDPFEMKFVVNGRDVMVKADASRVNAVLVTLATLDCRRTPNDYITGTVKLLPDSSVEMTVESRGTIQ